MKPNEIRAELIGLGITVKSIAEHLSIAAPSISQVISGVKRTRYIQEAVASVIGRTLEEVYPATATKKAEWSSPRLRTSEKVSLQNYFAPKQ